MSSVKLSDIGTFARGKSKHRPRNDSRLYVGGGYPLVQTGDVKNSGLYINCHSQEYNHFGLSQSKIWPEGTLAITIAANIAEASILSYPMCFPDSVVGFTANKEKSSELFIYYLLSYLRKGIQNSVSGTGSIQDNINLNYLENLQVDIPEPDIQQKIVAVLSTLDHKIELNRKINSELEQLARTLYDYWFVQFDFPNSEGNPYKSSGGQMIYNPELKREIPTGWKAQNMLNNDLFSVIKPNIDHFTGTKQYIATADVNDLSISDGSKITYDSRESRANMQPREYTVWFAKMKDSIKHILVADYSEDLIADTIFSTGFMGLQTDRVSFEYTALTVHRPYFELVKDANSNGATMAAIGNNDMKNIKILVPMPEVISDFHEMVRPILEKLDRNRQESQKLAHLRDWLIPMLMNGQVRVK